MNNKQAISVLSVSFIAWVTLFTYLYFCVIRNNCVEEEIKDEVATHIETVPTTFSVYDKSELIFQIDDNFFFDYATSKLTVPVSSEDGFEKLANYLKSNQNKIAIVSGLFVNNEGNGQLGLDRSSAIIDYLSTKFKLDTSLFEESFKKVNNLEVSSDSSKTYGAIEFTFSLSQHEEVGLEGLKEKLNQTRFIYFETGASIMNITPELHQFSDDLKYYSEHKTDITIKVVGYTDSRGSEENNQSLSDKRAKSCVKYLTENKNIKEELFQVSGKGETVPIATNDTDEGRAKNRRVEINVLSN